MRRYNIASLPIYLLSFAGLLTAFFTWSTVVVVIQFICMMTMGLIFILNYKFLSSKKNEGTKILNLFLLYGFFVAIHSIFVAKSYEQWSYLVNVFVPYLMLPCFAIIGSDLKLLTRTLKILLRITLPLSLFFLIKGPGEKIENLVYIAYVSPIFLFLLFLPWLRLKWKLLTMLVLIISWFWDSSNRSNLINITFSLTIVSLYIIFRTLITNSALKKLLTYIRTLLFLAPIIFIALGVLGIFNIFQFLENTSKINDIVLTTESVRTLSTDSRTAIYLDALNHLNKSQDWFFGSSATVRYSTFLADKDPAYNAGRLGGSESGFLGLLMFGGIVYVFLFFTLCFNSSKQAITKSNNKIIKLVGLFVVYRWFFTFIETPLIMNFSWVIFFLSIGICFNQEVRKMSDRDIRRYIRSL